MISVITLQITKQMRLQLSEPAIYPAMGSPVANSDYSLIESFEKTLSNPKKKKKMFSHTYFYFYNLEGKKKSFPVLLLSLRAIMALSQTWLHVNLFDFIIIL